MALEHEIAQLLMMLAQQNMPRISQEELNRSIGPPMGMNPQEQRQIQIPNPRISEQSLYDILNTPGNFRNAPIPFIPPGYISEQDLLELLLRQPNYKAPEDMRKMFMKPL